MMSNIKEWKLNDDEGLKSIEKRGTSVKELQIIALSCRVMKPKAYYCLVLPL